MVRVTKRASPGQSAFKHTWYIQEWMRLADKKQADLQKDLGWSKAKAHDVWHGQQYTQALIDELAPWLNALPYELLMHPEAAHSLRQLRKSALTIVQQTPAEPPEPAPRQRKVS